MVVRVLAPLVGLLIALGGCQTIDDLLESDEAAPLPGERIAVLSLEPSLSPDRRVGDLDVRLPAPQPLPAWPVPGGYSDHALHHVALADFPVRAWSAGVGRGADDVLQHLASPIVAAGRVYAADAAGRVSAFDVASGALVWQVNPTPREERDSVLGATIAFEDQRVFVATGAGEIVALAAEDGSEIWRRGLGAPYRGGLTVAGGRVYGVSVDSRLNVLAAEDGTLLWRHAGIAESSAVLGNASPAVSGNTVVVAYSSGELFALRVENGAISWSDTLSFVGARGTLTSFRDINGDPVIDRDRVLAVSFSGRMIAVDLRSGRRVWEREVASSQRPWVAGDYVFVVTRNGELACILRRDGRVRWVRQLQRYEDEERRRRPLHWSGPVLAGDRLIVAGSHGQVVTVSPYTGEVLGRIDLGDSLRIAPIVADGTLYFLTDDADLIAYR